MKKLIFNLLIVSGIIISCNNQNKTPDIQASKQPDSLAATKENKKVDSTVPNTNAAFPIKDILSGYFSLKNALAKDNGNDAAAAGNSLLSTLNKINTEALNNEQQKIYAGLQDDLKENAEHIGKNAGKIEHQREHFEMLSKDLIDLVKTFGNGGQTLYKDFCPMANNSKGASWLSEFKEIKNPYMGSKMPGCGSIKEEIK